MLKFHASSLFTPISYKMDSVAFAIKGGTFLGVPKFEVSFTFETYNIWVGGVTFGYCKENNSLDLSCYEICVGNGT